MDAILQVADKYGVGAAAVLFVCWIIWQEIRDAKKRKNFKGTASLLNRLRIELSAFKEDLESSVCQFENEDKKTLQTSRCNFTNEREKHLGDIRDAMNKQLEVSKQMLFYIKQITFGRKKIDDENGD